MAEALQQARTRALTKILADLDDREDAYARREAAYAAGEGIYEEAIPRLIRLARRDPDAGVQRAAEYALGMFQAIKVVDLRDPQLVNETVERVVLQGQLGERARMSGWRRSLMGLASSFVVLLLLAFILPSILPNGGVSVGLGSIVGDGGTRDRRAALARDVRINFDRVRADVGTLQSEFTALLGGGSLDCAKFFNQPTPFTLTDAAAADAPELNAIVVDINTAIDNLRRAYTRYDGACFNAQPLPPADVGTVLGELRPAIVALPDIDARLMAYTAQQIPPTAAPTETPAPTTTGAPTAIPPTGAPATAVPLVTDPPAGATAAPGIATAAPADVTPSPAGLFVTLTPTPDVRNYLPPLFTVIDDVTGVRGASSLLVQYWTDALASGDTDGCVNNPPAIPANVEVEASILAESRELAQAVASINGGLQSLRDGWTLFGNACRARTLRVQAPTGLTFAQASEASFGLAQTLLTTLR